MSGKVYDGQDIRIEVTCGQDITDAQEKKIKYIDPDGESGEWEASVDDAESGVLFIDTTLTQGWWRMWAFVTFSDGKSADGESFRVKVYPVGG